MKVEIRWGFIFSLASLLWISGEYLVGLHDRHIEHQATLTNLFFFPAVLIMYLAVSEKKRQMGGTISFAVALRCGLGVSVIVAILAPAVQYLFSRWINPDFFVAMNSYAVASGKLSPEQAQQHFNRNTYMLMSSIGAIGMGGLTSLFLAWLMRTRTAQ
ncbi:MAG: DUF4199 domain-containing protein [Acidobacteria bacterium]|nr:DUF4199 domain-containing protein [Acidobacteriota bacterium]